MMLDASAQLPRLTWLVFPRCLTVSYPESDLIYEWENFTLKINESNSWKLFQFDFTGVSNTTETVTTLAGKCTFELGLARGPGGW